MADWKQTLGAVIQGAAKFATEAARATLVDYDHESQNLWISQLALTFALRARNPSPGLFSHGLELQASLPQDSVLRLDVKPKPFGPSGYFVTDAASLAITPSRYAVACRVLESSAAIDLVLKAVPAVFDAMLGLGVDAPDMRVQDGLVMYGNALPPQSWFIALLRSLGGLTREAEVPIGIGRGGLILDLSQVLAPGVLIDAGQVAKRFLAAEQR